MAATIVPLSAALQRASFNHPDGSIPAEIVAWPYENAAADIVDTLPDTGLFDHLLLFPLKLGLSVYRSVAWLASTATNRQSNEMAKRLEPVALTRSRMIIFFGRHVRSAALHPRRDRAHEMIFGSNLAKLSSKLS
jgi:hypothetical protein